MQTSEPGCIGGRRSLVQHIFPLYKISRFPVTFFGNLTKDKQPCTGYLIGYHLGTRQLAHFSLPNYLELLILFRRPLMNVSEYLGAIDWRGQRSFLDFIPES